MGVDVRLYLYRSADPEEVAKAMAILGGNAVSPDFISTANGFRAKPATPPYLGRCEAEGGFWMARPKVKAKPVEGIFGMATIEFAAPVDPHSHHHYCNIHTISEHGFGWLLMPPSSPFWIAVCRRVVDIFGGALDHNDCDSSPADYFRFEDPVNDEGNGERYYERQQRLLDLRPLTGEEIEACREFAAYGDVPSYLSEATNAATA